MKTWMFLALCLTLWFVLLEVIELSQSGFASYFTNLWNVMDWANFILFFQVYRILDAQISLQERDRLRMDFGAQGAEPDCGSVLCNQASCRPSKRRAAAPVPPQPRPHQRPEASSRSARASPRASSASWTRGR